MSVSDLVSTVSGIKNQEDVLALLDEFHSMTKDLTRSELENLGNMSALYAADLLQQSQQMLRAYD